jgi:hypothetical protein
MLVLLCSSAPISADEAMPVLTKSDVNMFYVEYDLLNDHPECSEPGQIAVKIDVQASGLSYRVHDLQNASYGDVGSGSGYDVSQCYIVLRGGTEVDRVEVKCTPEQIARRDTRLSTLPLKLSFAAEMTSCLSPAGYDIIDGEWETTVANEENEAVNHGKFLGSDLKTSGGSGGKDYPLLETSIEVAQPFPSWALRPDHPLRQELNRTTIVRLSFDCIPFIQESYASTPLYLEAGITLLLVDRPIETCTEDDCPPPTVITRNDDTWDQARQCMPD